MRRLRDEGLVSPTVSAVRTLEAVEADLRATSAAYADAARAITRARTAARAAIEAGGKDACLRALNDAAAAEAEATELAELTTLLAAEAARLRLARPALEEPDLEDPFAGLT